MAAAVRLALLLSLLSGLIVGAALALGSNLPSGGQLAYVSGRGGDLDIYLLDISRALVRNLTANPAQDHELAWSPDGRQLAFVSDREGSRNIYVIDVACESWLRPCQQNLRRLTSDAALDYNPAWSPDGEHIVFASERFGYAELFLMDAQGRQTRRLTHYEGLDANPTWSPDGSAIVFVSDRDERWNADLYLMDAGGQDVRRLTTDAETDYAPDWSPDGRRVIYAASSANVRYLALYDLDAQQRFPLPLGERGFEDAPDWSPDGSYLAFTSFRDGDPEIYMLALNCQPLESCLKRLTFSYGLDTSPRWRP